MQRKTRRLSPGTIRFDLARALGAALLFSLAALGLWPALAAAQSTAIPSTASYACDFENSYCDFLEQSAVGDAPPTTARRSTLVSPGRTGSYAVRLHTEPGDNNVHGSGTWERDDLEKAPDASYCNQGQEEWWAVSVMFPSDFVYPTPGSDGGAGVFDFHHNADNGLPNFSVEMMPGTGMRIRGYGGSQVNGGQYGVQIADPYGAVGDVTRNRWYDFVVHIKWSANSDGFSEAWLNGRKIESYSGPTLYSGISCYLKLANYHAAFGTAESIIYDRVIRGSSAADVALGPLEGVNGAPAPSQAATTTSSPTTTASGSSGASGTSTASASGAAGSASPSATMDSSSYIAAAGQSVTFTARILGNSGTPGGNVTFQSDGAPIAGCAGVALSGGVATCTTSGLSGGTHAITGAYSGDSTYGGAQAGPITQTVTGNAASTTSAPSASGTASTPGTAGAALPTKFGMDSSSYSIAAGQAVTFTATIPGAGGTVDFQDNGNAIGACSGVGVSPSGTAYCSTSSLSAGTHAIRAVYSGSASYAPGIAGPITQAVNAAGSATTAGSAMNVEGLWWGGPSESGWGLNLAQQGEIVFATWFTYDANGNGEWLVMSDGQHSGNTYSGTLYRTTGPAFSDPAFDPSKVGVTPVGAMTLSFSDANDGLMVATVDGVTVTKTITRQVYGPMPVCTAGGSASGPANYQDLWWRPNGVESGWGLNIAHEGDILFVTWFTYDTDGRGMWLVGSDVTKQADGSYAGTLYRTTGPAFDTPQWDPSRIGITAVGTVRVKFDDVNNGVFSYTVDGVSGSKPITREVFSTPPTVCH